MSKKIFDFSWLNKNIIGFSLASFFNDLGHEMSNAALPTLLITVFGTAQAPQLLGIIMGIADGLGSLIKPISGIMSDLFTHRKPFIVIGYAFTGTFATLVGFTTHVSTIVAYKIGTVIGKGLREPARDAFIVESVEPRYYGRAFGFHRAMDTIGAIIGPLIAALLINHLPLHVIFGLVIIPGVCAVASIIFLTSEHPHKSSPTSFSWHAIRTQMHTLPAPFIYFCVIVFFFSASQFNKTLLILFAQQNIPETNTLINGSMAMLLYALFNITRAVSEFFSGLLSDFIGRKNLLALTGFGLFGITALLMTRAHPSWIMLVIIFMSAGISTAVVTALIRAYAADLLPSTVRATGYGLLQTIEGIGFFCASFIVGSLWSAASTTVAFGYVAAGSFIAMLLLLLGKNL